MNWIIKIGLGLLLALQLQGAVAAQEVQAAGFKYQIDKIPAWVNKSDEVAKPLPNAAGASQILLFDTQLNLLGKQPVQFARSRYVALERSGLEKVSMIDLDFNPAYEKLTLHEINLIRDGKVHNKLKTASIELIQPEREINNGVYNETVHALIRLDDVRIDDVVEVAYSTTGANPVFNGKFAQAFALNALRPIADLSLRVIYPLNRSMSHKLLNARAEVQQQVQNGNNVLSVRLRNIPALELEERMPRTSQPFSLLQVTEYASWSELQQWAKDLFSTTEPLVPELQSVIANIQQSATTPEQKTIKALNWVQNEIRYFSVAVGSSSHRPHPPNVTLKQRYGDCKDKSTLLLAMLKAMGIQAEPVLVSHMFAERVADFLPMPWIFDHVIVRAVIGGKNYWLDPTLTHQASDLGAISVTDYGKALLVETPASGLTDVDLPAYAQNEVQLVEHLDVKKYGAPFTLTISIVYKGLSAEVERGNLAEEGIKKLIDGVQSDYGRRFPNMQLLGEAKVVDDTAKNVLTVTQSFTVPKVFKYKKSRIAISFAPDNIVAITRMPHSPNRKYPLALPYPLEMQQKTIISTPNKLDISNPQPYSWKDKHAAVNSSFKVEGNKLVVESSYKSLAKEVSAANFARFIEQLDKSRENLFAQASLPLVAPEKVKDKLDKEVVREQINTKNMDAAERHRARFLVSYILANEIINSNLLDGEVLAEAYAERATSLSSLSRRDLALPDIDKALALGSTVENQINKAEILLYSGRYQEAVDLLTSIQDLSAYGQSKLGIALFYTNKFADAKAALQKAVEGKGMESISYPLIWLSLVGQKSGEEVKNTIEQYRDQVSDDWEQNLLGFVLGEKNQEQLLSAAKVDSNEQRSRLCEAYFYFGQKELLANRPEQAKKWFNQALDTKVVVYLEHSMAALALKQLGH